MSESLLINFDGNFFPSGTPVLSADNRGFRYGDGFFESMRYAGGKLMFVESHFARLKNSAKVLRLDLPGYFSVEYFKETILDLLQKNNVSQDARIRVTIFRKEGGLYAPLSNDISFLIEAGPVEENGFVLNSSGLSIDIFNEYRKPVNKLSNIKSCNALYFVLAGIFKNENSLDECIILNEKGNIIESTSCNIFAVKNGVLYTCPLSEGCVDGVMRQEIIRIALKNRMAVYEVQIPMNVLLNSDELFFSNAVKGVQWVGNYRSKKYSEQTSKKIVELLNLEVSSA